jgi:hypothetical protein
MDTRVFLDDIPFSRRLFRIHDCSATTNPSIRRRTRFDPRSLPYN